MMVTYDVLTVSFDSGVKDVSALCVARKHGEKIIMLKMELGEQADILYHLLTEQMTKAEIRVGGDQMTAKKTDKSIERGTELVPVGRLETQDAYLLDILKEQGFYLMYQKRETKFGELGYYQVLYPKEG